jgi:hypothetical protein
VKHAATLLALLLTASCAPKSVNRTVATPSRTTATSATPSGGIDGRVVAGPTCPAEHIDQPCPPRPVANAKVIADPHKEQYDPSVGEMVGEGVGATVTDKNGNFKLPLPTGDYRIEAGTMSDQRCDGQNAHVDDGRYTHVTITCDTGIR